MQRVADSRIVSTFVFLFVARAMQLIARWVGQNYENTCPIFSKVALLDKYGSDIVGSDGHHDTSNDTAKKMERRTGQDSSRTWIPNVW